MKTELIPRLRCPCSPGSAQCMGSLSVAGAVEPRYAADGGELAEGILQCGTCGAHHPVLSGVAVLLDRPASWMRANFYYIVEGCSASGPIGARLREWLEDGGWHLANRHADNYYETPRWINIFTATHYDSPAEGAAREPQVFDVVLELLRERLAERVDDALDIGTNVGGMAHRVARLATRVTGVDTAFNPVLAARRVNAQHPATLRTYRRFDDGLRFEERPLPAPAGNAEFLVASAFALPLAGEFDVVTALNVLDSVEDPGALLGRVHQRLRRGGLFALSSPYSWGSDDTPRERWLGGTRALGSAEAVTGALRRIGFEVVEERDGIPWVLREHRRWSRVYLNHVVVAQKP